MIFFADGAGIRQGDNPPGSRIASPENVPQILSVASPPVLPLPH